MLEDQVAFLLQKYLGNYVRGLNKEALKISVWKGDVELTNMQLRPEALNALKFPVRVKAGFLGSVKIKVPWSRLGQEPVLVSLDRILILAEPATQVEGCSEDAVQEAKKLRVRELEMKLLESQQPQKSEMNTSWLGSLISTIIGNLKLSVSNIHIRYEDLESNPGHPFAAGLTLSRLSALTIDDFGKETFATGGALDRIQKAVELEHLAFYFDSDIRPWSVDKPWEELVPSEWNQVFELGNEDDKSVSFLLKEHSYILQPVTGNAKYTKLRIDEARSAGQALQKVAVNLDNVTLCLSKDAYRDILKLADNFAAFNQRLKYAHSRPTVPVKSDPKSWWKHAYKVVTDEMKKASGKLSWEQVLRYARQRKKYVSLYASLLKLDTSRLVVDDNQEIEKLDRELDIDLIIQWRMLAHKFVQQSSESDLYHKKHKAKGSWWSFGWGGSTKDENEPRGFTDEDWKRLNKIIGYKEGPDEDLFVAHGKRDFLHLFFEIHMKHNASKLVTGGQLCLADLSCEGLDCSIKSYSEAKVFNLKLGSYRLSSTYGLLAESATLSDSLAGVFSYKPFDAEVDWSFYAKASPCYMTYLKDSVDQIIAFFKNSTAISQTIALETAAAVQMTIDGVKRTAQEQVTRALKYQSRFILDLDIAAPKITIPTKFCPDNHRATKLLLDLGNLMLSTQDKWQGDLSEDENMYMQFNLELSDVSAFFVDGDYQWRAPTKVVGSHPSSSSSLLPLLEKCGIVLKLEQIKVENPSYPVTRIALRLPSLGFHFSPARYHRLMQVAKIFQDEDDVGSDVLRPWNQADYEGWLSLLSWKGVGSREAVWQRRYFCLVGPFLYILENPSSRTYKQCVSLRGKQVQQVPSELIGGDENVLALFDAGQSISKVVEAVSALIIRCDTDESRKTWQSRLQGVIYRASGSAAITGLSDPSSSTKITRTKSLDDDMMMYSVIMEKLFIIGVLDELRISFSYTRQANRCFEKILLAEERSLFEFRAIGGQVELLIKANNMLIGTILRALEIEDLIHCEGVNTPHFIARSFINNVEASTSIAPSSIEEEEESKLGGQQPSLIDVEDDRFFEASDDLDNTVDYAIQRQGSTPEFFSVESSFGGIEKVSIKPPSFSRIVGLLPDLQPKDRSTDMEKTDTLDSFVKAQIVVYSQDSPLYNNLDNSVFVSLTMLSFFCNRPTILAIMEFVDEINVEEDTRHSETLSDIGESSTAILRTPGPDPSDKHDSMVPEPAVKGLLGKGKSRIIFSLRLNMAKAQILLMKEDGTSLATLSQNNLLTDIKVFPASFSIQAALGNLKISDDSLPSNHSHFWVCDMRNQGGRSFVQLDFSSFSVEDEDYNGYDYSLIGQLSEVRIVYLNRFVQEVVSYFMGLAPSTAGSVIKMKDNANNLEKWVTTSEIEGSPSVKLDLSLNNSTILMPRKTDSVDYLELDVLHVTVENSFQWLGGDKSVIGAIHVEVMTIMVQDINLSVGFGTISGENILQDVNGLSIVVRRSLRDLLHQIPVTEIAIKVEELKASLSDKEYGIVTECVLSNISEAPHTIPPLNEGGASSSDDNKESLLSLDSSAVDSESHGGEAWVTIKFSVSVGLAEISLHLGMTRDSSLATVQATGVWLVYKSNSIEEAFLFVTLKGFSVIDDREGTKQEFRLAIERSANIGFTSLLSEANDNVQKLNDLMERNIQKELGFEPVPSMLILDAIFRKSSTTVSICIQRPKLLVALDFILATVEFFVPSVRNVMSNEEDDSLNIVAAVILDQSFYMQPSPEFFLSPQRPLVADWESVDHFIYNGNGGKIYLQNREGRMLSCPSHETIIYVGSGKRLQFKNVTILNGEYLDSCISLGTNSSYSAADDDHVYLMHENERTQMDSHEDGTEDVAQNIVADGSTELIIELQAIGPELTFYNTSKEVGELSLLSNKVMHAHLDLFSRLVLKSDSIEVNGSILELEAESNGIRVLEPFDTTVKFSNASGKTNIHLAVSEIFMNFSFSILSLFLAVEEDILAFLRTASKKVTVVCSQFEKVGIIQDYQKDQTYAFWRPCAPSGFAVLGHCLTPWNEPPAKGVIAVNTSIVKVKRPLSFSLVWVQNSTSTSRGNDYSSNISNNDHHEGGACSIWFPIAPQGFVAVGCVVSAGTIEPSLSSAWCIMSSLVSPCAPKDCIALSLSELYSENVALWRVDNSFGSFLPADPTNMKVNGKPYEFRHILYGYAGSSTRASKSYTLQDNFQHPNHSSQLERSSILNSGRFFEAVASFKLIWWNQGTTSRKKLSIWRPMVPDGTVYLGDVAVCGYEPPNSVIVLRDTGDEAFLAVPQDFQLVGRIKKQKGIDSIYFWLPQAPPGFVALGCVATKGHPKHDYFSSLRCIRSDMVTGDQFPDESIWDSADTKVLPEPFSLWCVGNEAGTFIVRHGFRKPPKRFALKLAGPDLSTGLDNTVIDAEIKTFSATVLDDYKGLMVPLFNISLNGIGFNLHGRPDYLSSTASYSMVVRSYNDKYDAWEPVIEPMDGFLRYQYDQNAPGAAAQLRMTSTRDLNLNFSVSNTNMIFQAYSSWNNLSNSHEAYKKRATSPVFNGGSIVDARRREQYYIIPQNKLGQDIFVRENASKRISKVIKLPSGDGKSVKIPVSKNLLGSYMNEKISRISRSMVTIVISDAELPATGVTSGPYTAAVRLFSSHPSASGSPLQQQSARTYGAISDYSSPLGTAHVHWKEAFFFKVDSPDNYMLELVVTDVGRGVPVGFYAAALKQISYVFHPSANSSSDKELTWRELSLANTVEHQRAAYKSYGRIRFAAVISASSETEIDKQDSISRTPGFIQISPTREGPWATIRLNYSAPAACSRLGNVVVTSEVAVEDGNIYVTIRSLVSVTNNTDYILDLHLKSKRLSETAIPMGVENENVGRELKHEILETDEYFEVENYSPSAGWISCSPQMPSLSQTKSPSAALENQVISSVELPDYWERTDDWHVDRASTNTVDGWVYSLDTQHLKWPESEDPTNPANHARQRRWIRHRKYTQSYENDQIPIESLKPGHTIPLPLSGFMLPHALQFRPKNVNDLEYSWSNVLEKQYHNVGSFKHEDLLEICVTMLTQSDGLLYCGAINGSSSETAKGLWFCLSIEATEIGKDIHSNSIYDWHLNIHSPLSLTNFLPLPAEYAVIGQQVGGETVSCLQGTFGPGETIKIYNADVQDPLYLSVVPRGWELIDEPVPIPLPNIMPSKTMCLRNSTSGRIVQIILEQSSEKDQLIARNIRIYAPYWIACARCPPLMFSFIDMSGKRENKYFPHSSQSNQRTEKNSWQISQDELTGGNTIASALNFKQLGFSASLEQPGKQCFGPPRDLSPLGDMDGSIDGYAYDTEGNKFRIFVSAKQSPYQAVPTKVISIRPFMTFTNRLGQDLHIKFSVGDQPKVLHASDGKLAFICCNTGEQDKLQVQLEDTYWSYPVEIVKEDTITIVLRRHQGDRTFLRAEVRGYDDGSRFLVVFRLGSADGPIRVENRTFGSGLDIRQSGFDDYAWIHLEPRSTTNFSWEDPCGPRVLDIRFLNGNDNFMGAVSLEGTADYSALREVGIQLDIMDVGDVKIVRFTNDRRTVQSRLLGKPENLLSSTDSNLQHDVQSSTSPLELIIEMGLVGISLIDHRPRELLYLHLEKVFISYSSGYDAGNTSRFKLIVGQLQVDNQLPLTPMPVLLVPEDIPDINHPVFKATITMNNENIDGIQVYPYIYIRVTETCWRISIHEPVIWALVDFYKNLRVDISSSGTNVTQVDPEIRFELIDISETRLKISLETAPTQRPAGALGMWSPILSAVGNAFKIQVHLRKVMHTNRFMRKSSIFPAILNRIRRDLIHNPLHLILSVDVLGMTKSTLSSLSKGFAELSTDGQFLQLRSKQVWSRKITGISDGLLQGTEALAQGVAFGVSGVLTKPVENARQHGLLGFAHGLGRAFLGFFAQPLSGALDFASLTVDGIGASFRRCLEILNNKATAQRIRNPRAIHADGILHKYHEREAVGQMVLYLAEASQHLACTDLFKEPSKYAWSDYYEDHFMLPYQRIVLVTNKRVMLLKCLAPDKLNKKPSKILWDVPWEDILALELAKAGHSKPSHLIIHLKYFRRSESFVRIIKCDVEEDNEQEPQAVRICSSIRRMWKAYQSNTKLLTLKVPSIQQYVQFAFDEIEGKDSYNKIMARGLTSVDARSDERRFIKHSVNFQKIWSSELEHKDQCTLFLKQVVDDCTMYSIWRPLCPDGYVSVGDVARLGNHAPNVAAIYQNSDGVFAAPMGYDLVWRNCPDDYTMAVSIWLPRPLDGFVALGCVAMAGYEEPPLNYVYCVSEGMAEEALFEQQPVWTAPDSYPWSCYIYQVQSEALQFIALRQPKEESDWKPMRVASDSQLGQIAEAASGNATS